MSRINVLVASTSIDIKAAIIAARVADRPDMSLVGHRVIAADDVDRVLEADPSLDQVAIVLLGTADQTHQLAERWLAQRRSLVVMLVDVVDDVIRIQSMTFRDPRLDAVLTALRQLVEQVGQENSERVASDDIRATPEPVADRERARDSSTHDEPVNRVDIEPPRGESVAPQPGPTAGASVVLRRALEWLDAALLCVLRVHQKSVGDHPLTVSHALVDALLVERTWPAGSQHGDACQAAANAATALSKALTDPEAEHDPLAVLSRRLPLSFIDLRVVLLALAPELDALYQLVFGVLNDDMGRRAPTLALVCQILGPSPDTREALTVSHGLTRWHLFEHGGTLPHADEPLRVDGPIVNWLLGDAQALAHDPRLAHVLGFEPWPGARWLDASGDLSQIGTVAAQLRRKPRGEWIVMAGEDSSGLRAVVEAAAWRTRACALRILLGPLAGAADQVPELSIRLTRAALLMGAVPVVDAIDAAGGAADAKTLATLLAALTGAGQVGVLMAHDLERVISALPSGYAFTSRRQNPTSAQLAAIYAAAARGRGLRLDSDEYAQLAHSFRLPFEAVEAAVRLAALEAAADHAPCRHAVLLTAAFRRVAAPDLPLFATRIDPVFALDDIVLPPDRRAQLDEIVAHVRHAPHVLHTWGFDAKLPYGRGVAALFSGPSGCGKSMAAQAIAGALHTQTYVLDLSRVVSKYIGDSEKNIDLAFRDAQRAGAVLQIDEAEAMFGKRSEVKDAHDRYANIEVAYLLQRMEAFDGVAILTTNLRDNLDPAFLRRLRFVVDFPKPDAEAREAIWRRGVPATAPFQDVNIRFLARRLELTGANIRQITIRAAFLAAAEGAAAIEMRHVMAATKSELVKLGMGAAARDLIEFEAAQDVVRIA